MPGSILRSSEMGKHTFVMEPMGNLRISSLIALASVFQALASDPYCGSASLDPFIDRIVGGVEVTPHEFPWMVKLYQKRVGFVCGATLIADRYLLTAGHCLIHSVGRPSCATKDQHGITTLSFQRHPADDFYVELGTHDLNESEPTTRRVLEYILHQQFSFYLINESEVPVNDIAILKTDPIDFNYYTLPICLPPEDKILPDRTVLVVAGWGNLKGNLQQNLTDSLMKTSFLLISAETCKKDPKVGKLVNAVGQLSLRQAFCLASNQTSPCRGDSGGPVFVYTYNGFELTGIISSSFGCRTSQPGYCTQVSMYMEFIHENTMDGVFLRREEPKNKN